MRRKIVSLMALAVSVPCLADIFEDVDRFNGTVIVEARGANRDGGYYALSGAGMTTVLLMYPQKVTVEDGASHFRLRVR